MEKEILQKLRRAVVEYDLQGAENWATRAIDQGLDPLKCLDALTEAIREVGDGFNRGDLWLPDLVGAASAMQRATPLLQEALDRTGKKRKGLGTIVLGTVKGDIHTIGKDMVAALLRAEGFVVFDLGIDVTCELFLEAARDHEPDIVALSALMTTTAPEQKKVIAALKDAGLRDTVKVIVGGGAINEEFAVSIGADGYGATAPDAVSLARRLTGR